jgi:hypothetical protein
VDPESVNNLWAVLAVYGITKDQVERLGKCVVANAAGMVRGKVNQRKCARVLSAVRKELLKSRPDMSAAEAGLQLVSAIQKPPSAELLRTKEIFERVREHSYRAAATGFFIMKKGQKVFVRPRILPRISSRERATMPKEKPTTKYRSAISGRYVSRDYAKRHPKTTMRETRRPRRGHR